MPVSLPASCDMTDIISAYMTDMAIGLDAVTLVSIFVECILYGLLVFLFATSSAIIILRRNRSAIGINKILLGVSVVMFVLATVHVGADLRRMLEAFLGNASGPVGYLSSVNTALYTVKRTAYCAQTLVGDGFMLYRLHLVWRGDKRVVLPILVCFIASIGVGIGALQGFARASPAAPVFITELHDWIVSFFSLTLFPNFSSTLLIATRIWWIHRRVIGMAMSGGNLIPAAVVIIESGAIYSACLIILLSLYLSGSYAQYIVLDAVTQVVGIVFSLVIVRVALGVSSDTTTGPTKLSMFSAAPNNAKMTWQSTTDNGFALRPVAVNVSRETHTNTTVAIDGDKESGIHFSQDDSSYDRVHKPPQGQHFNMDA